MHQAGRSVVPEAAIGRNECWPVIGKRRVVRKRLLIELDSKTRRIGDEQVTALALQRLLDEIAFGGPILVARVLLHGDVVYGCIELGTRRGEDTAQRVMRHHPDVTGLRQRGDLRIFVIPPASERSGRM